MKAPGCVIGILAMLAIGYGFYYFQGAFTPQPSAQAPQSFAAITTAQPDPTATPDFAEIAQATVAAAFADANATSQAAVQAVGVAQSDAAQARALQLDAQQNAIYAQQTAVQSLADVERAQADKAQADNERTRLQITQTVLQVELGRQSLAVIHATEIARALIAAQMQSSADASRAAKEAQVMPYLAPGLTAVTLLAIIAGIGALVYRSLHIQYSRELIAFQTTAKLPTVSIPQVDNPSVTTHIHPPAGVPVEQFTAWSIGVLNGAGVSIADVERDNPFTPVTLYRRVVAPWAEAAGLFVVNSKTGVKGLSTYGRRVIESMITAHSPAMVESCESGEISTTAMFTTAVVSGGAEVE